MKTEDLRIPVSPERYFAPAPENSARTVRFLDNRGEAQMSIQRLRAITIAGPLAYLLIVEAISILVLVPLLGNQSTLRLLIAFLALMVGTVPFSIWIFRTIERQQRNLAESATVLENVQEYAIFGLDAEGRIATWSPGAQHIKGYAADEVIGKPLDIFYPPEDVALGRPLSNLATARGRGRYEDEGWRVRKNGTRFWAHVVSTAVRDENGTIQGFVHVVRDMTERKLAQEAMDRLTRESEARINRLNAELQARVEETSRANEEIARRNRELQAVNTAISSVSGALDLTEVLQRIVDAARDLVQTRYAALGVANESGAITQFITAGITPEQRAAIGPLPQGHGLLAALIKDAEPLLVPNIGKDSRSHGFPPNHPPMTTLLGVPILFKSRPVGDLYLTDKIAGGEFTQDDLHLVELLANHAAVAIENARLYEEVRSARDRLQVWNEELEAKVQERTRDIERYSRELTTRVLRAQEEERKRIARELHDDTAQSLSTLLINLDLTEPYIAEENPVLSGGFERVRTIAKRTLDSVRALSHDLRPTILDDFGLVAALKWYGDEYTKTFGIPVSIQATTPPRPLPAEVELALFRITQEALTNTGKYAQATSARVALTFPNGSAHLIIEDNGKGFDPAHTARPTRSGGLGLHGMQERADLIGGSIKVESAPGEGTCVTVDAPLPET